jgi:hypothetical protein
MGQTYVKLTREEVLERIKSAHERRSAGERDLGRSLNLFIFAADLRGVNLTEMDLSGEDLSGVDFTGSNLIGVNFDGSDLTEAICTDVYFINAKLNGANLTGTNLVGAHLSLAQLKGATLTRANLSMADLFKTDLSEAILNETNLSKASLIETNLTRATITGCKIFGISAWDLSLEGSTQYGLIISRDEDPIITLDNIEVAKFIFVLLRNEKIRNVIDTITSKVVLILGRFTSERKAILDTLRDELRNFDYVPIIFDFERPTERDFTETIMTFAGMCRFIIADITNPKSSPLELQATVPDYMIPFVPIIQQNEEPFAMFKDLHGKYDWVLDPLKYEDITDLIEVLEKGIIEPALEKYRELMIRKAEELPTRSTRDYLSD